MSESASEASILILHRSDGIDKSLSVLRDVLSQENKSRQTPVEEPGPTGVSGCESGGQLSQLLMQKLYMEAAVQMGYAVGVAVVEFFALKKR
jgi:hypothetical protein